MLLRGTVKCPDAGAPGRLSVSASKDNTLRVWVVETGIALISGTVAPARSHAQTRDPAHERLLDVLIISCRGSIFHPVLFSPPLAFDGIVCVCCNNVHTIIFNIEKSPVFMRLLAMRHVFHPRQMRG